MYDVERTQLSRMDFCENEFVDINLIEKILLINRDKSIDNHFHFRIKSPNDEERTNVDSFILSFLHNYFNK